MTWRQCLDGCGKHRFGCRGAAALGNMPAGPGLRRAFAAELSTRFPASAAKAIGLAIPALLFVCADQVIG